MSADWCDCALPHRSYCIEPACRWGAAWPRPEDPLLSMESVPWFTQAQAVRRAAYQQQARAVLSGIEKAI